MLVVSRITEERAQVRRARQVLEEPAGLDLQLRAVDRVVQVRRADRPASVDGVEIEGGRAAVDRLLRIGGLTEARPDVEGDVVVDELPEEGGAGRVRRVVRVVRGERRVGYESDRSCRERILRVEEATRRPERT